MILLVTGTGTDVGKTVVTAALAATAKAGAPRNRVAVVKVAQTGVAPDAPGDLAEVTRLSGVTDVHEFARYPEPLSPHHAAALAGVPYVDIKAAAERIEELDRSHDVVIVEGAGGLLVPYDDDNMTIIDLLERLIDPTVVLVTLPGLGTLNHTFLALKYLDEHGYQSKIVIGRWPAHPGLAELMNVDDLARTGLDGGELAGAVPEGAPAQPGFAKRAPQWLAPSLGGTFDVRSFRRAADRALARG